MSVIQAAWQLFACLPGPESLPRMPAECEESTSAACAACTAAAIICDVVSAEHQSCAPARPWRVS